jgi:putative ABC transport system permease protein
MFKNFFLTAHRNIVRNKIQSAIQVTSLTIGITAVVLIGLYAKYELSYDRFNEKLDRIYRLEYDNNVGLSLAPGHQIMQNIPEVESMVRLLTWDGKDFKSNWRHFPDGDSTAREKRISVEDIFWCDTSIFNIFSFNFIQGDPKNALRDPKSLVLTESTARNIFGDEDPVGRVLADYTITGIIKDVENSHLEINLLGSISYLDTLLGIPKDDPRYLNNWIGNYFFTYLLLPEHVDPSYVETRINEYFASNQEDNGPEITESISYSLRPLEEVYFTNGLRNEHNYCRHGNKTLLIILITTAVSLLMLAIINYVNLTTARASLRSREVGIRKAIGSSVLRLIQQFLTEAILISLFSFLLALTLVQLMIPQFNKLASTDLEMPLNSGMLPWVLYILAAFVLGVISGIYPAFIMVRFKTIESLSGVQGTGSGSLVFRRMLLTVQFTVSIILIIGLTVVVKQLRYMKTADLGFDKDLIIYAGIQEIGDPAFRAERQVLKQRLLEYPGILGVAFGGNIFGSNESNTISQAELNGIKKPWSLLNSDPDLLDVMGMELLEGRLFSWDRPGDFFRWGDNSIKILINETALREYELKDPVGFIETWDNGFTIEVIGVVRDFNFKSQHEAIEPCILAWGMFMGTAFIKIAPENVPASLRYLRKEFEMEFSARPFQYSFLDETYDRQYHKDEQTVKIIIAYAFIAILLACLGLFGLASFMAARKTKEIGIRKTMGASERSVFLFMTREFVRWVMLSVLIACPAGWILMNRWLQTYAYHTNVGLGVMLLAVFTTMLITFLTVSWHSIKTARTNPVDALRYE